MKNTLNKLPKKLWIPAMILSILSIIPMYFTFIYIMDMTKLADFDNAGAVTVDDILSRNIHEVRFLLPCIFICLIAIPQAVLSAFILKGYKGWANKGFAITNLFFGGIVISNIFLLFSLLKEVKAISVVKVSSIGVGTVSTVAIPLAIFSISMGVGSIDDPTSVKNIIMSDAKGQENVLEIFTDGFDPVNAQPFFNKDSLFNDFISMDRMVTGGYTTEPSYTEMMGGIERNPYFLKRELDEKDGAKPTKGLSTVSWTAYLHENFMDSALNRVRSSGFTNSYMGNPDDDGYFKTYFQHVSGDPQKLIDRNEVMNENAKAEAIKTGAVSPKDKKLSVYNWGQAKNETATAGVSPYQNNVAVYKWMEGHMKVQNDPAAKPNDPTTRGSRIFLQDSITHAPRVMAKDGTLSFTAVADSASLNQSAAFIGLHKVLHDLIQSLKENGTYDNTLIAIYGDHSDHSNPIPNKDEKDPTYIKNWGQAIIKYPHVKKAPGVDNDHQMFSNKTAFYIPNMGDLISDYFDDKTRFNGKTAAEQSAIISADLKSHVTNYNHFVTLEASDEHSGSFVTFENIDNSRGDKNPPKLVPYTPTAPTGQTTLSNPNNNFNNWMNYKDDFMDPNKAYLEEEILGMGWV